MREYSIATAPSRKTKNWKNITVTWGELCKQLTTPTRTAETVAEYRAMGKSRQSDIKDTGGFVGGYCPGGNRSAVSFRSILCLDADFAEPSLWDDWCLLYGCAAAVYSTHKHTPERPRFRLVVPLSRDVDLDEYQAIGRRVAATLGIEQFDDTSYQPQRLMYWPSVSKDGVFDSHLCDGEPLDADAVLATYRDWRDISSWPMSSRVAEIAKRSSKKAEDPLEKAGLVGAFCRAYSIEEAIEAFVPVYQPCDIPGRYTYTEGSTAAGVITYDGKFSFSHHATDPASSQLCNAFDLVRLHMFGTLDEGIEPDAKPTSRPSYKAMVEFSTQDSRVSAQIVTDRMAQASADVYDEPLEDDWRAKLKVTDKGALAQTIENAVIILRHDPQLAGRLAFNEMSHNIVAVQSLPWRTVSGESQWVDADDAALRFYLERLYGLQGKDRIFDAVNVVAAENKYHPVRAYLDSCSWDGVPRVETLLVDYLGADDNAYTRAVTRKTLIAAVSRIYRPGCKFDYMLTLRGRQGLGKSAFIAKLGGQWFSDSFGTMQGKEAYEQVQGVWIMEVGELAGLRKAEAETIKLYITKQSDRFRPAYGRRLQEYPRQCVFIGTTNESQFLRDTTGNRRFWIVDTPKSPTHDMWDELTPDTVAKIWGEAVELYKAGEDLFLTKELEKMAKDVQAAYEEENPRVGLVADYLERLLPDGWDSMDLYARRQWLESDATGTIQRTSVCSIEIWAEALSGNPDKIDRYALKDVRDIMSKLPGWAHQGGKVSTFKPYGRQRFYRRIECDI